MSAAAVGAGAVVAYPEWRGKRILDAVAALAGLVVLSPLLAVVALGVCATSPGPPLFRQPRAGRGGRPFVIWKFRTMVVGAEAQRAGLMALSRDPAWLHLERDPRVTRLGRLLRRTSVDELPQLWNVLRGDMSLVGPRPLPLEEHAQLPAWAWARTAVRPGLTGPWQVTGRVGIPFAEMLRLDCEYARHRSARVDAALLLRTVPALLTARGAN